MSDLTWKCHVCGEIRPDALIAVFTRDISAEHHLPAGTVTENIRYCIDRPNCVEGAKNTREYLQAFAKWAKEKQAIQNMPQIQQASCVWEFVYVWGFTIAFELNFHAAGCGLGGGGGSAF